MLSNMKKNYISVILQITNTGDFARTWGKMKSNRSEEMNYEKMSRAMRQVLSRALSHMQNLS